MTLNESDIELSHTLYLILGKHGEKQLDTVQVVVKNQSEYYIEFVFGMWEWHNESFDDIRSAIAFLDKYRDRKDWAPKLEKLAQKMIDLSNYDW
ncbi:hypothetical protein FDI69_gp012 [Rhodococcus phage Trina]|uniref:Uncharacterized protein n=1 Tax=Rhodococcus phage Trina TaxID=2027905 RepID=A0A2D1A6D3_9CAUD|nr:hypothetical protein FDI69_gp012 [Rhodococcus phage Trina]ASZ74830.1 hypothetical protein SEA_TRINA_12 [Rhodococcus phage Trina]